MLLFVSNLFISGLSFGQEEDTPFEGESSSILLTLSRKAPTVPVVFILGDCNSGQVASQLKLLPLPRVLRIQSSDPNQKLVEDDVKGFQAKALACPLPN